MASKIEKPTPAQRSYSALERQAAAAETRARASHRLAEAAEEKARAAERRADAAERENDITRAGVARLTEKVDAVMARLDRMAEARTVAAPAAAQPAPMVQKAEMSTAPETAADLLYGVPKIATHLGMRERQARHLCDNGTIPTFRVGGTVCARRSAIDRYFAEQEVDANGKRQKA